MILGDVCTRRCPFCDVAHGRPEPVDVAAASKLADAVETMGLRYVVITSSTETTCETVAPDISPNVFRRFVNGHRTFESKCWCPTSEGVWSGRLDELSRAPPDVFNHNLETVPRLYKRARPGAKYDWSLDLIKAFKTQHPHVTTKSGLMLGLGERNDEVLEVLKDLREHDCDMVTLGQYLSPSRHHLAVERYVPPIEFDALGQRARALGFERCEWAVGTFVVPR